MKCPKCVREGTTSTISDPGGWAVTAMGIESYWDAEGVHHVHDPNHGGQTYRCSLGHRWYWKGVSACPAGDYGGKVLTELADAIQDVPMHTGRIGADGRYVDTGIVYGWRDPDERSQGREAGAPATGAVKRGTTGSPPATQVATPLDPDPS